MKKLKSIMSSYKTMCIFLIVFIAAVLIYHVNYRKGTILYSFSGYNEEFTILEGTIYIGHDINRFSAPQILYNGDNIILKSYEIGYFIKEKPISVIKSDDNETLVNAYSLISASEFTFQEVHKEAMFFRKDNLDSINKMEFRITGTTDKGESVNITVPLEIKKLTK